MSKFEDTLWTELACAHGADLTAQPAPAGGPGRHCGRLVAAAAGVVALATAGVLAGPSLFGGTPAAYAMTTNPDGSVGFVLKDIAKIDEANRALRDAGIHAAVVKTLPRAQCHDTWEPYRGDSHGRSDASGNAKENSWTIHPDQIPGGTTLLLSASGGKSAGQASTFTLVLAVGAVPGCLPVDAPLATSAGSDQAPGTQDSSSDQGPGTHVQQEPQPTH